MRPTALIPRGSYTLEDPRVYGALNQAMFNPDRRIAAAAGGISDALKVRLALPPPPPHWTLPVPARLTAFANVAGVPALRQAGTLTHRSQSRRSLAARFVAACCCVPLCG